MLERHNRAQLGSAMRTRQALLCLTILTSFNTLVTANDKELQGKIERLARPYVKAEQVVGFSIGVLKTAK